MCARARVCACALVGRGIPTCSHSKFEFAYALNRKGVQKMVAVVMEPRCLQTQSWQGVVGGKLGGRLFYDFVSDDDGALDEATRRVAMAVRQIEGPRQVEGRSISLGSWRVPAHRSVSGVVSDAAATLMKADAARSEAGLEMGQTESVSERQRASMAAA